MSSSGPVYGFGLLLISLPVGSVMLGFQLADGDGTFSPAYY